MAPGSDLISGQMAPSSVLISGQMAPSSDLISGHMAPSSDLISGQMAPSADLISGRSGGALNSEGLLAEHEPLFREVRDHLLPATSILLVRKFERNVTKFAPHKALKLIVRGKLTFDERVILPRVGTPNSKSQSLQRAGGSEGLLAEHEPLFRQMRHHLLPAGFGV